MSKRRNTNAKLAKKEEKKAALRRRRRLTLTLVASILGVGLVVAIVLSIVTNLPHYASFTVKGDTFLDGDTDITYYRAPSGAYEPVTYYNRVYGKWEELTVHEIKGAEPKEWLALELSLGICDIFYAEDVTLPTLRDFDSTRILVCVDTESDVDCIIKVTDEADLHTVTEEILTAAQVTPPSENSGVYTLRFESQSYPFLYYCVKYVVGTDGSYCYYDYAAGEYRKASALVNEYIARAKEASQTTSATEASS